jgi:hypothetical protein
MICTFSLQDIKITGCTVFVDPYKEEVEAEAKAEAEAAVKVHAKKSDVNATWQQRRLLAMWITAAVLA